MKDWWWSNKTWRAQNVLLLSAACEILGISSERRALESTLRESSCWMSEECPFHLKIVSKMEPLEYRSVIKFLNMQGKSPSVIFEEMFSV